MLVGIDLGTTNSLIGVIGDDGARLFPNALGSVLTPSAVSIGDDGSVLVGQAARDRLITHPDRSVAAFKRFMGTPRETRLDGRAFRAEDLSALVLRSLLADAEAATGVAPSEAVISVPAYFSDAQRKATRAAGELAGIRVERLINEPTAAALAYGLQHRDGSGRFLVLDLGGGTFDVSILEMFEGVVEVHASAGDNFLGGEDFIDLLLSTFATDAKVDPATFARSDSARLRRAIERLMHELSNRSEGGLAMTIAEREFDWRIEEERFSRLAEPLAARLRKPLERAMRDARLQPSALDEIVLVGGASRLPLVARLVTRMFGRLPMRHVNPDRAIVIGAATAAAMKARDARFDEVILTDVCPYTLGTQVSRRDENDQAVGGFFHPVIHRNSTVPISREDTFWPLSDGQTHVLIDVYQGESPMVANNIRLGQLDVPLPPRRTIAQNGVDVRFTYDINGVLQVEARLQADGTLHELVIEQNPGLLTREQIQARFAELANLKIHPRSEQENIALVARAERLYEEHVFARDRLQDWIMRFRNALESQDPRTVAEHRNAFRQALDELESGR